MSTSTKATEYNRQAEAIAQLATAIANGDVIGPVYAAVRRLADMADTLQAWTEDDRSQS